MKVYQWRMNTKLEAESKDNRLQIAQQTILSQNFELGQLRTQNETVTRNFMLKCDELAQVEKDMEFKISQYELLEKAIDVVKYRIEKQEIAVDQALQLDETHTNAVVELTGRYVKLKTQLDCLEKAKKQVVTDLQSAREEIDGLKEDLNKLEVQSQIKIDSLEKLILTKDEETGELKRRISTANDEVDAKEREVDNFKALRHKELREKGKELELAKEEISQLEEDLRKSRISEEDNDAKIDNLKKLILSKAEENEELEKRVSKATNDACAKQQELDSHKALRHKELREKGEELQTSKKEISQLTEALCKLEEENNAKIDNLKKLINCKDREIEELEKTQQHLIQEHKEQIEARSIDYDTELRMKNSLIQNLEKEMSRIKVEHKAQLENFNKESKELKKRISRANDEVGAKKREVDKTLRHRGAPPKKAEETKPVPTKRRLIESDLSPSDDEGKLFEDFFNKPKKTYASKTPERKKFFVHKRAPPSF